MQNQDSNLTQPPGSRVRRVCVDEHALADELNVSVHFLRKDRRTKKRIPFFKIGDLVRYNLERVQAALLLFEEGGAKLRRKTVNGRPEAAR